MRGSWNHVPSRSYVSFITERFKAYSCLLLKVSEHVLLDAALMTVVHRRLSESEKLISKSFAIQCASLIA
jgi:hypothetical protein